MTRINAGIKASELPTKLLVAERRELIRIPNLVKKGKFNPKNIPPHFKLGTGHVSWFYNKLGYLKERYEQLTAECIKRGIKATDYSESFKDIDEQYMGKWDPSLSDRSILIARINERGFELI
jgi:deoxyribonuclease (pyrimidine dimer)